VRRGTETGAWPHQPYHRRAVTGTSNGPVWRVLAASLDRVMRLLGVLALAAPVALGILFVSEPRLAAEWIDEVSRSVIAAVAAATIAVALTGASIYLLVRIRFGRLVKAAERIAAGDYSVTVVSRGGGLDGRLARAINGISTALTETHDQATFDRLTGVANRSALLAALFAEVERAARYERPLSVAFVDIDHFKAVNDSYGHAAGDIVLRGVAQALGANLRASDMIGRYGGEEFMLILTETDVEEGAVLTEKLRQLVQRQRFAIDGNPDLSVTISIGIAGGSGQKLRVENLVRDADAAMYSAKSLGRNQTYIFAEPDDDARVPRAPISNAGRARAVEIGRQARLAATAALASYINPLPHYRGQPSALIATIVVDLARQLQLSEAEIDRIQLAALLHDVGKVAIPEEILEKPAALSTGEWRSVVQHPRIGQVILEQAAALKDAVPIILHHHERYAGHGYPYGLRANEIPLGARIVAIADAYDAMINDRPYKRAMSHDQAIAELRRHSGTQFDPELVSLFCDLYAAHAPKPDPTVLAMTEHDPAAQLVVPGSASRTTTIRRAPRPKSVPSAAPSPMQATIAASDSTAMAAEGSASVELQPSEVVQHRPTDSIAPVPDGPADSTPDTRGAAAG
jgi:diguanylate cyclase (GGDEF)-like protein